MNSLNKLFENSLYSNDQEKSDFVNSEKLVHIAFWIGFLGPIFLYINSDNPVIKKYFKSDKKLRIDAITDDNNDTSLTLSLIKTSIPPALVNKITRFLVRLKSGQKIDEDLFKKEIFDPLYKKTINLTLSPQIKRTLKSYYNGNLSSLDVVKTFIINARRWKICNEFKFLARKCKIKGEVKISKDTSNDSNIIKKDNKDGASTDTTVIKPPIPAWENYLIDFASKINNKEIRAIFEEDLISYFKGEMYGQTYRNITFRNMDVFFDLVLSLDKNQLPDVKFNIRLMEIKSFHLPLILLSLNPKLTDKIKQTSFSNIEHTGLDYFNPIFYLMFFYKFSSARIITEKCFAEMSIDLYYNTIVKEMAANSKGIEFFTIDWIADFFFNNLYKLEDKDYFVSLIKFLINNLTSKEFIMLKSKVNDNLKKRLIKYGLYHLFEKLPIDKIKMYDFQQFIETIMSSSYSMNKIFEDYRKEYLPDNSLEEIKKIFLNQDFNDLDFSRLNNALSYISVYDPIFIEKLCEFFNNEKKIVDLIDKMIKNFNNNDNSLNRLRSHFIILFPNYFSEKERNEIFEKNIISLINVLQYCHDNKSLSNLENWKYEYCEKIINYLTNNNKFDKKENSIISNINLNLFKLFGDVWAKKLFSKFKDNFLKNYFLISSIYSKNKLKIEILRFSKILDKNIIFKIISDSDDNDKKELTLQKINELFITIVDKFDNSIDIESLEKIIETLNEKLEFSSDMNQYQKKFITIELLTKNIKYKNNKIIENFYVNLFKQNPGFFCKLNLKNLKDLKEIIENHLSKKQIAEIFKNKSTEDIIGERFNVNNINFINLIDDNDKKIEFFKKYINEYKRQVNSSLKRGGIIPKINNFAFDLYQKDPKIIDKLFDELDLSTKNQLFAELRTFVTIAPLLSNIHTSPVVPLKKLKSEDIRNALKYNKFEIAEVIKVRKRKGETYSETLKRTIKIADASQNKIPKQKVEEVELTEKEIAEKTYNLNKKYHAGKHGSIGIQLLKEFNVSLPEEEWKAFREEWKDKGDGILYPMFHGTNGTAASMILRFGFAILSVKELSSAGGKYAGNMLGAGVYTAPNMDKVANYIGEQNYGQLGSIGYLFEIDQTLGEKNNHYRTMGHGGDRIRSPEYCSKYPRKQLKIVKCYKAVKSSLKHISKTASKNGVKLDEAFENQIHKGILMESDELDMIIDEGWTNFIFMDGYIPIGNNDALNFSFVTSQFYDDIQITQNQDGIVYSIKNDIGNFETFKIPDTFFAIEEKDPIISKFLNMTKDKLIIDKEEIK